MIKIISKYLSKIILIIFTSIYLNQISLATDNTNSINKDGLTAPLMWNLKHFNEHFVGRKEFLQNMHKFFFEQENNLLVISGEGGSGKAEVIQRYAEQHQSTYNIVWWLDVRRDLKEQYRNFALEWNRIVYDDPRKNLLQINFENLNEDELIEQVNDRLRITKLNWLIILDKVQETADALKYSPKKPNNKSYGHIIISTKNSTIHDHVMHLGNLKREESIELLFKLTGEENKTQANLLAATLDDNPLAVSRAGLFIASYTAINMEEYNRLFTTDRQKLWDAENQLSKQRTKFNSYKATVFSTKARNIDEVKKESAIAYEFLAIISFLDHKNIPELILKEYFKTKHNKDLSDIDFNNALSALMKYSLLNRSNNNSNNHSTNKSIKISLFTTHELTQLVMRDLLGPKEKSHYLDSAISAINKLLANNPHSLNKFINEYHLIDHITLLNKNASELGLYNNEVLRLELAELEYNLTNLVAKQNTEELINKIEEITKHIRNQDNSLMLKYSLMKSEFLGSQANYTASKDEALSAYEIIKKLPDTQPEEKLMIYNRLARLYNVLGNNVEALKYAELGREVVERNSNLFSYKQDFYRIIARIYIDQGDLAQALKYAEAATSDNKLDSKSIIPLSDISAHLIYADILIRLEKLKEAEQKLNLLKQVIDNSLPKEHLYQANIMIYCSYVKAILGSINIDKAIQTNLAAQAMHKKLLGETGYYKNRHAFMNHRFLGEIYEKKNNNLKAENEYSTGLKIITNIYDNQSDAKTDDLSYFYTKLAIINVKLHKPKKALELFKTHRQIFGKKHLRSLQLMEYFGDNKVDVGM